MNQRYIPPEKRYRKARLLHQWWTAAASIIAIATICFGLGWELTSDSQTQDTLVYIVGPIFLLAIGLAYGYFAHVRPLKWSHIPAASVALDEGRAHVLQVRIGDRPSLDADEAKLFVTALLFPDKIRERIIATFEPSARTIAKRALIDGQIPNEILDGTRTESRQNSHTTLEIPLPVLTPRKGELYDNFTLHANNNEISALPYVQALELAAQVLRALLRLAYDTKIGESLTSEELHAERKAILRIIKRRPDMAVRQGTCECSDYLLPAAPGKDAWLQLAYLLVDKLTNNYAIIANVECDRYGRFSVEYRHTEVVLKKRKTEDTRILHSMGGFIRTLLNANILNLAIPLEEAWTAQSYHVYVNCNDNLYVARQEASGVEKHFSNWNPKQVPPYCQFKSRSGQSYGHFYTRYFPKPKESTDTASTASKKTPRIVFYFSEVPPGSTFRAAVAAAASTVMIWFVALISSNPGSSLQTDAPAFLLVFPAVVAAWLGVENTGQKLFEGTLAVRLSLFATVGLSVLASGLYLIFQSLPDGHETTPSSLEEFGWPPGLAESNPFHPIFEIDLLAWSLLFLASLANATVIAYLCALRVFTFSRLNRARRPQTDEIITEHDASNRWFVDERY